MPVKIFLSLWMNEGRPLWWHVYWQAGLIRLKSWLEFQCCLIYTHEGFREDWNIPGLTMHGLRSTLKRIKHQKALLEEDKRPTF